MLGHFWIRDINQLRNAPPFGLTALQGFSAVESMLAEAFLHVPCCQEHRSVWSPRFAQIIIEAASQIDSLWKATTVIVDPAAKNKLTIEDHFVRFGVLVAKQRVVFFGGNKPITLVPFKRWDAPTFNSTSWWKAYNKLKHNRFSNQHRGTLGHAVNAASGLLLAIIYSGQCDLALLSNLLLETSDGHNPWAYATLVREIPFDTRAKIETKLLAHPLGIFGVNDCNLSRAWGSNSVRFNAWWALNSHRYTTPHLPPPPTT